MRGGLTALVMVIGVSTTAAALQSKDTLFQPSDTCLACHNNLRTASGEDVSIGADWRATMMANSSRDPYWQASVRREVADFPAARAAIEDECSVCHMPMARTEARAAGRPGEVFSHLPVRSDARGTARLAHDGVSCTACHQITSRNLGTPESFNGGYVIDVATLQPRPIFGPFQIDKGRTTIMRSSSGFQPTEGMHIQQSELCATCHTLYTKALDAQGREIGRLPEQMPYLEWRHSDFVKTDSCQACHMPPVSEETPITSVLGEPRRLARHFFRGGNAFMLRMLNRYRDELGIAALPDELDRAATRTVTHLQTETASVDIQRASYDGNRLVVDVAVQNRAGHKLPTGYPSRRAWIHLQVRAVDGRVVFESGAVDATGLIDGNDSDRDATKLEPHYTEITAADQVQIYESVMGDATGAATTGLLSAVRFLKDNRLLPRGFDKRTAAADIAVVGAAAQDSDFEGGGDRVRYAIALPESGGPYEIDAALRFQSIGYRWAQNLKPYDSSEARRFVSYYESMAPASSEILGRSSARVSSSNR